MSSSAEEQTATGPLLEPKLYRPEVRPEAVARRRLLDRLERGAEGRLTLLSAPAGFGKTTVLAAWLEASERPGAWLSLDAGDSDPARFWTYFIAALRTVLPGIGSDALAQLQTPQPPPAEVLIGTLLNELAGGAEPAVLVLDDYHAIESEPVHEGIAFLLEHLPAHLHLVIATRADPPLPLSRLRARGQLAELRAADLRFSTDEAAAFLNEAMGLDLSSDDVGTLEARTEGWIAGLQLAALSLQGRDDVADFIAEFAGDDRYIVDYLMEEVLRRQPDEVRRFLLETSILDRLSGPLCDAVTGDEGGAAMLESLERANLFVVPLDDKRRWYRYHHLFADILRAHLAEQPPDPLAALHRRASEWFEEQGERSDAIRHALAAPDPERAASLIERAARTEVRSYRPDRLLRWVELLPDELVRSRPVLSTYYAYALFPVGDFEGAERRLRDAEHWIEGSSGDGAAEATGMVVADESEFAILPATIALARAFRAQALGDVAATREQAQRALERLPDDDLLWRGGAALLLALADWSDGDLEAARRAHDAGTASLERAGETILAASAAYDGAELRKAQGRLREAGALLERWLHTLEEQVGPAARGMADLHIGLGALHCEQGDIEAAAEHLRVSEALGPTAELPEAAYRRCIALARLRQAEGDIEAALAFVNEAEGRFVLGVVPDLRPAGALRARLWIAAGRPDDALRWAADQGLSTEDELDYRREFEHITLAAALVAEGRRDEDSGAPDGALDDALDDALGLLARLLEVAEARGRTGSVIEILVLEALGRAAAGSMAGALTPLARALGLAEPHGYVRCFLDEGEPLRVLLRHAAGAGISTSYVARLLEAFAGVPEQTAALSAESALVEALTAREGEVLRLIAAGLRNQEIADQLVISLATVKRHIANAYGKLDARHRIEAVARANELGLL